MTTKQELAGKWDSIVGAVEQKYGRLTGSEMARVNGDLNKLAGLIQQKTGQTREQVEAFFDECCQSGSAIMDRVNEYAESTGEALRDGYGQVSDQARRSYDHSVRTMSRHPWESVGTALGIGLIAGVLIGLTIARERQAEPTWRDRWHR